jgi:hypothetical protein
VAGVHQRLQDRRVLRRGLGVELVEPTHHPGEHDAPDLERLAQALDRVSAELRELVEEQHRVVRQC